ncbi:MAG: PfkB family carbohydrate kinase, partial [Eubacteriales bacterium]|nr:PfkB family carbohydrate kinase [Eubacteriales bacterium]
TREALTIAKENDALISFDPNYRAPLWDSEEEAKQKIIFGLQNCDILKISDNEIELMTGTSDIDAGIRQIIDRYEIPLVFATLGRNGSRAYYGGYKVEEEGFLNPDTIETTGAGDTFCACALHFVLRYGLKNLTKDNLHELLLFANAAASVITTRKGALCVMPEREEVEGLMRSCGRWPE